MTRKNTPQLYWGSKMPESERQIEVESSEDKDISPLCAVSVIESYVSMMSWIMSVVDSILSQHSEAYLLW